MTTIREQILAAIVTTLAGTAGVGSRIYRSRVDPVSRAESPALIVEPMNDVPSQNTSLPTLDQMLTVRVLVIVRDAIPDQAADSIIESLHAKLMTDQSLGGLVMDIMPGPTDFSLESADVSVGVIQCLYKVQYRTRVNDLTSGP
jgi:hypothetical protein